MIIFGYPGIGKTTLVKEGFTRSDCHGTIDLESSMFRTDMHPERSEDWYQAYGNIAIDLSNQGFLVFCACHPIIRDYIAKKVPNNNYVIIFPSINLREEWLYRLRQRYFNTKSNKDLNALEYAENHYSESVYQLYKQNQFDTVTLENMEYDLREEIERIFNTLKEK